jgi:hypothetical protein
MTIACETPHAIWKREPMTHGPAPDGAGAPAPHRTASSNHITAGPHVPVSPPAREHAGKPWRRSGLAEARLDARAFASAGIPLTLLMDLADPSGPDSWSIYWAEPAEGDTTWAC